MGFTAEFSFNLVQRIQNLLARRICNIEDYIHSLRTDLIRSLKLKTVGETRVYSLCLLIFKSFHCPARHYLNDYDSMHVDVYVYDTRSAENMHLIYTTVLRKFIEKNWYKGSLLWNKLPLWVKESTPFDD